MPAKYEGLLDDGRMEDVSLQSKNWTPVRPSRWSFDRVRPEFWMRRPSSPPSKPIRPTAWLDGLKGFAAFTVYWHHHHLWAHMEQNHIYENAFGYEGKRYFVALPFVRNFFSGGHFAVAIFFVISGYVLSVKSLSLIQKGEFLKTGDSIGSALFRRWLRLYIPVIAITFVWITQFHTTKLWAGFGKPKGSYKDELWYWYMEFKNYSFIFTSNIYEFPLSYQAHAWSIPVEFKGSIIIYTTLSALSRCTKNARLWCELGLMFYFMYIVDGWYGASFISGLMLCDLDLLVLSDQLPRFFTVLQGFKEFIFFHLFVFSLYLGGVPSHTAEHKFLMKSPGWVWLSYLKPQAVFDSKWFYLFWAALFVVASVPRIPRLKRFFETRFCQYLGRICFALYLVHGPVIWILGDRLYAATGWVRETHKENIPQWCNAFPLSKAGPLGFELAFWAPQLILLPVTLYLSEVATKLFDEQSTKFTNWLYRKTLAPPSPSPKA